SIESESGDGVLVRDGWMMARGNNIEGSGGFGIRIEGEQATGGSVVIAPDNWWGDASGPGGAGPGAGDEVSPGVAFTPWLMAPVGVYVQPDSSVVLVEPGGADSLSVAFGNFLLADDVLDVTIRDPEGWVVGDTTFEVPLVQGRPSRRPLRVAVPTGFEGAHVVIVRAVSQTNPDLAGEARVFFATEGSMARLPGPLEPGEQTLPVEPPEGLRVGDVVVLNPGGVNEEEGTVSGFGSIILAAPLRFPHAAGELVVPLVETDEGGTIPETFALSAPYPNPFTIATTLRLDLPEAGEAEVAVFDALGRRVAVLLDREMEAGAYEVPFEAGALPSGVYLVRAIAPGGTEVRAVTLLR
ncbi:MAG TPA: T9SS type A sorting domain-containing protein, partial [Rubricoccaceae bacterium]|nr:T9SS type A sorting domain-containing protein [Rubricoccaceae bacterium]